MAGLSTGESFHHGASEGNLEVSQGQLEEGGGRWYLSRKEIEENSPSRQDGIDLKKETYLRKSYSTFLQKLGEKLKLPQVTIATAIVFCHRFFLRQSHANNDRMTIAIACMFLAGKVEETPRHLKDVVLVSYQIIHEKDAAAVQRVKQKEVYEQKKELILLAERIVLVTLGFDLNVHHPYKPLVEAIKKFKLARLAQFAWNFVNDGLRTSLCLQFQAHQIAAGAIFLAAKRLEVKLPSDGGKAWWQEFGVSARQLEEYCNQMLELYEQHTVPSSQASSSLGRATLRTSYLKPAPSRPGPDEHPPRITQTQNNEYEISKNNSISDRRGEDGINDLQHHEREATSCQGNSGVTQNKTEFGIEGHGEDDHEGNSVQIEPSEAEEFKDVTFGQSSQDATKKLDREKLKAAFEQRKARGDITRKVDHVDELERELENVEVPVDSEKTKCERKQSWSKLSKLDHEKSHHVKYGNEAGDAHYQVMKGQSFHGDDFDTIEEGEVEPSN